jgi:hypothetical protein
MDEKGRGFGVTLGTISALEQNIESPHDSFKIMTQKRYRFI